MAGETVQYDPFSGQYVVTSPGGYGYNATTYDYDPRAAAPAPAPAPAPTYSPPPAPAPAPAQAASLPAGFDPNYWYIDSNGRIELKPEYNPQPTYTPPPPPPAPVYSPPPPPPPAPVYSSPAPVFTGVNYTTPQIQSTYDNLLANGVSSADAIAQLTGPANRIPLAAVQAALGLSRARDYTQPAYTPPPAPVYVPPAPAIPQSPRASRDFNTPIETPSPFVPAPPPPPRTLEQVARDTYLAQNPGGLTPPPTPAPAPAPAPTRTNRAPGLIDATTPAAPASPILPLLIAAAATPAVVSTPQIVGGAAPQAPAGIASLTPTTNPVDNNIRSYVQNLLQSDMPPEVRAQRLQSDLAQFGLTAADVARATGIDIGTVNQFLGLGAPRQQAAAPAPAQNFFAGAVNPFLTTLLQSGGDFNEALLQSDSDNLRTALNNAAAAGATTNPNFNYLGSEFSGRTTTGPQGRDVEGLDPRTKAFADELLFGNFYSSATNDAGLPAGAVISDVGPIERLRQAGFGYADIGKILDSYGGPAAIGVNGGDTQSVLAQQQALEAAREYRRLRPDLQADDGGGFGTFLKDALRSPVGGAILAGLTGGLINPALTSAISGTALGGALGAAGSAAAAGALTGGLTSALTGGDVLRGALGGGFTGGLNASGIGNTVSRGISGALTDTLGPTLANTLGGAGSSALVSGVLAGLTGNDVGRSALGGAVAGGIQGSGIGQRVSEGIRSLTDSPALGNAGAAALTSGLASGLLGGNALQSALGGGISSLVQSGIRNLRDQIRNPNNGLASGFAPGLDVNNIEPNSFPAEDIDRAASSVLPQTEEGEYVIGGRPVPTVTSLEDSFRNFAEGVPEEDDYETFRRAYDAVADRGPTDPYAVLQEYRSMIIQLGGNPRNFDRSVAGQGGPAIDATSPGRTTTPEAGTISTFDEETGQATVQSTPRVANVEAETVSPLTPADVGSRPVTPVEAPEPPPRGTFETDSPFVFPGTSSAGGFSQAGPSLPEPEPTPEPEFVPTETGGAAGGSEQVGPAIPEPVAETESPFVPTETGGGAGGATQVGPSLPPAQTVEDIFTEMEQLGVLPPLDDQGEITRPPVTPVEAPEPPPRPTFEPTQTGGGAGGATQVPTVVRPPAPSPAPAPAPAPAPTTPRPPTVPGGVTPVVIPRTPAPPPPPGGIGTLPRRRGRYGLVRYAGTARGPGIKPTDYYTRDRYYDE